MTEKILLVDANNLTLRSVYGCAQLYDSEGNPTGGLMTSIRTTCKAGAAVRPMRTFFIWDGGHSKFRKMIHPEYKFRGPADEKTESALSEWTHQVKMLEEYLPLLGVGSFRIKGCEADDIIFRLANLLVGEGFEVSIASTDADFFQMIKREITLYHLSRELLYNEDETLKEYGIYPDQFVDWRALVGDKSDNIKGVDGVGKKRATDILQEYYNLDEFFKFAPAQVDKKTKRFIHSLLVNREIVERNRKLMDLSKLPESEVPQREVEELLEKALQLEPKRDAFWKACIKHQLNTLLQENYLWATLWRG